MRRDNRAAGTVGIDCKGGVDGAAVDHTDGDYATVQHAAEAGIALDVGIQTLSHLGEVIAILDCVIKYIGAGTDRKRNRPHLAHRHFSGQTYGRLLAVAGR